MVLDPRLLAVVGIVPALFGAWLFVDSYFAKQKDLLWVHATLQQADIQMRIDYYEDRLDREKSKSAPSNSIIQHLSSQIRRLELRYKALTDKETQ